MVVEKQMTELFYETNIVFVKKAAKTKKFISLPVCKISTCQCMFSFEECNFNLKKAFWYFFYSAWSGWSLYFCVPARGRSWDYCRCPGSGHPGWKFRQCALLKKHVNIFPVMYCLPTLIHGKVRSFKIIWGKPVNLVSIIFFNSSQNSNFRTTFHQRFDKDYIASVPTDES